ncbi:hypothetical protein [Fibrella aquatilis]|uniref:Uncharacterized protein n=1 Tax=Fibrella aquatilis TaxID=2817059 RepID=A0A939JZM8_9BACT|nr:hypothetical protein [Fibrella aquatilis]MBO0931106.1 hypothetical protein [Fibrella aquatilis]
MIITYSGVHRTTIFALLTACLIGVEMALARSTVFSQHPSLLSFGILFDCTVVVTLLFYGLVARPLRLPSSRTILVALAMLRVALFILPTTPPTPELSLPILAGLLEGCLLVMTVLRIRTIRQTYRALRPTHGIEMAILGAFATVFGENAAVIILSEGQVMYYALFNWRKPANLPTGATAITTHRESGQVALLAGLLSVGLIEAAAMHVVLAHWWPTVAFWATLASLYSCLIVLAIINAIRKRPSFCTETALHLRLDIRWQVIIARTSIIAITPISEKPAKQPGLLNASLLTAPNVLITLREPVVVTGMYGLSRTVKQVSLFVDDRTEFTVFCRFTCSSLQTRSNRRP